LPVSYIPCIVPLFLVAVLLVLSHTRPRTAKVAAFILATILASYLLSVYIPGWVRYAHALKGDPFAEYRYAQWLDIHNGEISNVILIWPVNRFDYRGFRWLEKAAAQQYPPAVWVVGARLRDGWCVPRPPGWTGPGGGNYPQPERGQAMMDHAVNDLGFRPPADVPQFLYQVYGKDVPPE